MTAIALGLAVIAGATVAAAIVVGDLVAERRAARTRTAGLDEEEGR